MASRTTRTSSLCLFISMPLITGVRKDESVCCPSSFHECVVTDCAAVGVDRIGVIRGFAFGFEIVPGSDSEHCPEGRVGAAVRISLPNGSHQAVGV